MSQTHQNVKAELARRGKNQGHLSPLLGITRQAVSQRLLGRIDFRVSELQAIADYLEVPVSALIGDPKAVEASA